MATLFGHIAIASAATKIGAGNLLRRDYLLILFISCLLSIIPDFDVISFKLGIPYAAQWGHRGATHSIVFGLICSIFFTLFTIVILKRKNLKLLVIIFTVYLISILSHTFLDMLTNGGLGCAVLWPFDQQRYFFPITPIPVSPIGIAPSLIYVVAWEFFLIFPILAIAYTLKSELMYKAKYFFATFYTVVLIASYWIRLK